MDELQKLRENIDLIDSKLIYLFQKRMEMVMKVADYKKINNLPILNVNREEEVINKNLKFVYNQEFKDSVKEFLIDIMKISKELQSKKIKE